MRLGLTRAGGRGIAEKGWCEWRSIPLQLLGVNGNSTHAIKALAGAMAVEAGLGKGEFSAYLNNMRSILMVLAALTMGNWYAFFTGVASVLAGRKCLVDGRSDGRDTAGGAGVDAAQGRVAGAAQEGEGVSGVGRCNLFCFSCRKHSRYIRSRGT